MGGWMDFTGKVVLVTGGSLGIGAAACHLFASRGASVIIASRQADAGRALAEMIAGKGGTARHLTVDVADEASIEVMVAEIGRTEGRLDVLVNNAGIHMTGDAEQTALDDWNRVLGINLTGAFLCTKHALSLLADVRGCVVNVSSEAGLVGIGGQVAYNVSKAGMIALTRSCAVDFAARGIRVNCVCPGTTETPLVDKALERAADGAALRRQLESSRPANRLGTAGEVASAIVYLASDEAAYSTGAVFSVDGGYTAQ